MSNADILIEMVRLGEQIGEVEDAHMYPNDYISIYCKTKDGKTCNLTMTMPKEEKKDA